MIRCGAFCFAADAGKAEVAVKSAKRLAVAGAKLRVIDAPGVRAQDQGKIVSLAYSGSGLPAVHGWLSEGGQGEYSLLSATESGLEASRDYCGTRPLYLGSSGSWVASDHRFFPGEKKEQLPRGAKLFVSSGRVRADRQTVGSFEGTFDDAAGELAALIRGSVKSRVAGRRRVAVAFSGGLDSSIVAHCASSQTRVVACSVAAEGSTDSKVAREAAGVLGLEFLGMKADAKAVNKELLGMDLPFEPSAMDRSLWCIYSMTSRLAAESGAEIVMLGQLADELFGGYAKYEAALKKDGEAEAGMMMSQDVDQCGMRGLVRDEAACRRWCEPRFPFAQKEVAVFGEGLPVSFKLKDGVRKAVLRESATLLGLPREIASKPKKAAQYSSGMMKLLS